MRSLQVLNIFKINIQNIFMHRVKTCNDVPSSFATPRPQNNFKKLLLFRLPLIVKRYAGDEIEFPNKFTYPSHRYPTSFSKNDFA